MSSKIEIIPSDLVLFKPKNINKFLDYNCLFFDNTKSLYIADDELIDIFFDCRIKFKDKYYWLYKIDFEYIDPAIEYIENYNSHNLNVEKIAKDWESLGFSFHLSPEDKMEYIDNEDFKELVLAICKYCLGAILIDNTYSSRLKIGLYDIETWKRNI